MSFYGIKQGSEGKILTRWTEVQKLVTELNAKRRQDRTLAEVQYKKFPTEEEAKQFLVTGYTPNYEKRAKRNNPYRQVERIAEFQNDLAAATESSHAIFYVDGACDRTRAQLGVFSVIDSANVTQTFTLEPLTSNRCELAASIAAMQIFLKQIKENDEFKRCKGITIFTDNKYSKETQDLADNRWFDSGVWLTSEKTQVLNIDLLRRSVELRREILRNNYEVAIRVVPGHRNTIADALSKEQGTFPSFQL